MNFKLVPADPYWALAQKQTTDKLQHKDES
jgi:hypothetical protein